mmetsp:Transcript_1915/g.4037  ORF Transcript_1915/g.4037 Transcript_1915/m.4037 type:complete len:259 (-) Transcript_1915:1151-1927(-)
MDRSSVASSLFTSLFTAFESSFRKVASSVEMYASSIDTSSSSFFSQSARARLSKASISSRIRVRSVGKRETGGFSSSLADMARSSSWTVCKQAKHGGSSSLIGRCSGCWSMCSSSSIGGIGKERWLPSQSRADSIRYSSEYFSAENGVTLRSSCCISKKESLMRRPVLMSARFSTSEPTNSRQNEAMMLWMSAPFETSSLGTGGPSVASSRSVVAASCITSATMPGRCCLRCCRSTRARKRESCGTPSRRLAAPPSAP